MVSERIKNTADIIDLCLKGLIAACVAGGGFLFKQVYGDLQDLKATQQVKSEKLAVVEVWAQNQDQRLNRMESKLDEVLKIARESK